jgi:N-acetylglucosamine-6-phosphate deacetylase
MMETTHSSFSGSVGEVSNLPFHIINARVPGYKDLQMVSVNHLGVIDQIVSMDTVYRRVPFQGLRLLDVDGDWVSLGGVDLQINGALGLAFPDLKLQDFDLLEKICDFLWLQGVDGFLPTLVTTSVENIHCALEVISNFIRDCSKSSVKGRRKAKILGVHLEGPFLNYEKRGAHPPEYLLSLTVDEVKRVLGNYADIVKIVTLAPELDTTGEAIPYLRSLGITVSLGHSQATVAQGQQAFDLGATMVTHAFNAMPSLHHREPGLLGAALTNPNVMSGFIADGEHVSPIMIDLLLRASNYEQGLFLVSDALSPLGLPDGVYPWDSRQIEVKNGTARLPDGTLSGTTLSLLVGVRNLIKWGICDLEKAIALATIAPRKAIGLGQMSKGEPASLLRWHYSSDTKELSWGRLPI